MITLHAFSSMFPGGIGETKDMRVQWALEEMSPAIAGVAMFDAGFTGQDQTARDFWAGLVRRWFDSLERHLQGREWIAADAFTVADIALAGVLREARDMEFPAAYPGVRDYAGRALARPAWQRTRELTARRMGVALSQIA